VLCIEKWKLMIAITNKRDRHSIDRNSHVWISLSNGGKCCRHYLSHVGNYYHDKGVMGGIYICRPIKTHTLFVK
jgi:hypothetical protein